MKQYKSPGLDGIINEFYQIYWDTIKEDLFEVLLGSDVHRGQRLRK